MIPLLVIRHGPTDWNVKNRLQGRSDRRLSDQGKAQVRSWNIPQEFKEYHCISSPLARATETAQLLGKTPDIEPALAEMSWGEWEGQNWQSLQMELGPEVVAAHQAKGIDFCPDGGESPREVQARLKPWLTSLDRPTVAISHKGVLQALYAMATDWQMTEKAPVKFRHGEAFLFQMASGRLSVGRMNIPLVNS